MAEIAVKEGDMKITHVPPRILDGLGLEEIEFNKLPYKIKITNQSSMARRKSDSQDINNNSTFVPDETLKLDDIDIKTFIDKGVQCNPDPLLEENLAMTKELEDLKRERDRHKWSAEKMIANDDGKTKYYTGLPFFAVFIWLF
ncbi:uncharacterized protein LOC134255941, partial [Saccostrea cucullata]|uniref:uncharacterized protein LOC134255941 n=1 Tax=Saccostrea cuccullata TaxID=36930 RepID=UPI002ED449A4